MSLEYEDLLYKTWTCSCGRRCPQPFGAMVASIDPAENVVCKEEDNARGSR